MTEDFQIEGGLLVKYRGPGGCVVIPSDVTSIRGNAFSECAPITSVTFPAGLRWVGEFAFNNCDALQEVHAPSLADWLAIDFQGFRANPLSNGARLFVDGEEVVRLRVPDGTCDLGQRAFEGCATLQSVTLPAGLRTIGKLAFGGCPALRQVTLPAGLEEIGYSAFRGCSLLAAVEFPAGLRRICAWAFAKCTSLISVELPDGLQAVERDAFYGCSSVGFVRLPDSLTALPDDVFYGCSALSSLRIPASVAVFGAQVFARCGAVRQLWLEGGEVPAGFQPPAGLQVLVAHDLRFCDCWRTELQQPLAAGFVKLAAEGGPALTPDCAAYVMERVPQLLQALDFGNASVKWFLDQGLIPAADRAALASQASAAGQMEAAALLLDAASSAPAAFDPFDLEL